MNWYRHMPVYVSYRNWRTRKKQLREFVEWHDRGKPVPPPHFVKQQTLMEYAQRYQLKILVETGTYRGDMVEAMRKQFERLYSIELNREFYSAAKRRFQRDPSVRLVHGDSGVQLKHVLEEIDQPCLFWLDGHYSGGATACGERETPILNELDDIFSAGDRGHVIIIDDARAFGTDPAYPSLEELSEFIRSRRPDLGISVETDSIRIVPEESVR